MFTTFAPDAIGAVTQWVWVKPPGYRRPRYFLFGGCLFWVVIGFFVYTWFLFKTLLWAALVLAIGLAQLAVWGGNLVAAGYNMLVYRRAVRAPRPPRMIKPVR